MKTKTPFSDENVLIPAIIQDHISKIVYMLGYMNKEAYDRTTQTGYVHFWSRSRKRIWMKGEESGNKLKLIKIQSDCDGDTFLVQVYLEGSHVCHTGTMSCFDG